MLESLRDWLQYKLTTTAPLRHRHDMTTALQSGVRLCRTCHRLSVMASEKYCSRCHAPLHYRKPDSLMRCWALVIASVLLLFPANLIPIMTVVNFGKPDPSTILSGIIKLWHAHQYLIAVIVFIASFVVPIFKLAALIWLLAAAEGWIECEPLRMTRLYRFLEFIGRWSMLDVFVVALMVTLVQLANVTRVVAGEGALAFCAVVVLTMFASHSFDPRLLWDRAAQERKSVRARIAAAPRIEDV